MLRRALSAVAAAVLALFLTACPGPTPTPTFDAAPAEAVGGVETAALPLDLHIPALGIDGLRLDPLGLDPAGALEVPPDTRPERPGWYAGGVRPGRVGPAVVAGHVSGRPSGATASTPGVFARLHTLRPGDQVVIRSGRVVIRFEVTAVETYAKQRFPTARVYGDTRLPELRLITCGGVFDPTARSYDRNVVVYAVATL